MFLVDITHQRFDAEDRELFSGKIGVFPLVTHEPAKRSSINRAAGTLEIKPITSVNKQVIRSYLIEKVLPAINEKWLREEIRSPIYIQQDNARTHIDTKDDEFCRVASRDGFDIRLMCQPTNSPDLNVLDLGFCNAIQSLQHKESPNSIDKLVKAPLCELESESEIIMFEPEIEIVVSELEVDVSEIELVVSEIELEFPEFETKLVVFEIEIEFHELETELVMSEIELEFLELEIELVVPKIETELVDTCK
ncbi:hypothetical protein KIW84_034179 [Lathyrus oleraceus]|uniref:Transposase n=1 Tax=Pisum sativum TaxID=3888 RepID=A0A9D4Y253_PEA|nr:hypothetical protein KIW84_034179 [Pisum sativum]